MKRKGLLLAAVSALLILVAGVFFMFSAKQNNGGSLLITQFPVHYDAADAAETPSRIAFYNPGKGGKIRVLTNDFWAAGSPSVSYDGRNMVFAAIKNQGDIRQIWEMDLSSQKTRQITSCAVDCTDPVYLPDGRIAFSRRSSEEHSEGAFELVTCKPDGSDKKRITHHPGADLLSTVMDDGRIVVSSHSGSPEYRNAIMMVMRPDGTKAELYYRNPAGWHTGSRFRESPDGQVVFTETDTMGFSRLVSIDVGRPLSSSKVLSGDLEGEVLSAYPVSADNWVVAYRKAGQQHSGLYNFDVVSGQISGLLHEDPEWQYTELAAVGLKRLPRVLPSPVDEKKDVGAFICIDADDSDLPPVGGQSLEQRSSTIQLFGLDGLMAEMPLMDDGSFYAEVPADTPIRFVTLDESGRRMRGPSAWVWVRPNERRGCVGCHENREMSPENRLPLAIMYEPGYKYGEQGTDGH